MLRPESEYSHDCRRLMSDSHTSGRPSRRARAEVTVLKLPPLRALVRFSTLMQFHLQISAPSFPCVHLATAAFHK